MERIELSMTQAFEVERLTRAMAEPGPATSCFATASRRVRKC